MKEAEKLLTESGYSETHWGAIIIEAERRGFHTRDDSRGSKDWLSCACGKLDKHIKKWINGSPVDRQLRLLGIDFNNTIALNKFLMSARTLIAIEKRSLELLEESKRTN